MKRLPLRTPLMVVALVPLVAVAGAGSQKAQVDQEELRGAVPASTIIGQDVKTRDGREFGEIESIVFKKDGSVAYYGIEPDMDMYAESDDDAEAEASPASADPGDPANAATSMSRSATAAAEGEPVDVDGEDAEMDGMDDADAQTSGMGVSQVAGGDDVIQVKPESIKFAQNGEAVSIDMDGPSLMKQRGMSSGAESGNELDAAEVIGMQVDLADEESFGEVEDILISQEGDKAVALVVDNWDGVDKQRRALPVELESADQEQDVIRYEISKNDLDEAGDFDLDQYSEQM